MFESAFLSVVCWKQFHNLARSKTHAYTSFLPSSETLPFYLLHWLFFFTPPPPPYAIFLVLPWTTVPVRPGPVPDFLENRSGPYRSGPRYLNQSGSWYGTGPDQFIIHKSCQKCTKMLQIYIKYKTHIAPIVFYMLYNWAIYHKNTTIMTSVHHHFMELRCSSLGTAIFFIIFLDFSSFWENRSGLISFIEISFFTPPPPQIWIVFFCCFFFFFFFFKFSNLSLPQVPILFFLGLFFWWCRYRRLPSNCGREGGGGSEGFWVVFFCNCEGSVIVEREGGRTTRMENTFIILFSK